MKNLINLLALICSISIISCSDTEVTRQETSEIESLNAPAIAGLFKKRVLIEDFTGTWCGNCVSVLFALEKIYETPNNSAVTVAIHSGNDPFKFVGVQPLHEYIFPNGNVSLPEARLNRNIVWKDQDTNIAEPLNLRSNNCGLGLSIKSNLTNQNINLNVEAKFAQNYSGLKIVVYLLENKLRYKQTNYTQYYTNATTILDFEHNHVLRKSITNLLGDQIEETIEEGKTINKNYSFAVPANVAVSNNISFVAFIVDSNNNVINVRESYINQSQVLEENL